MSFSASLSASRFRTVFLGTPEISVPCLKALVEDEHFDVLAVVTQPDRPTGRSQRLKPSPVKEFALEKGLRVLTPETVNEPHVLQELRDLRPETAVVVAFGQILSPQFLDLFPKKAVNIHASLLPRWRGAGPIQRALVAGDRESGVSLQIVVPKLDAGPVIGVRKFALDSEIHAGQLYERMKDIAPELLRLDYLDFLRGQLSPSPQDETGVTIARKIKKEEGLLNWGRSATELHNLVRGLWMWPGTWTFRDEVMLKIKRTRVVDAVGPAGTVVKTSAESFVVACGQGALEVLEVQPESRPTMSAADYMRGHPLKKSEVFGGG